MSSFIGKTTQSDKFMSSRCFIQCFGTVGWVIWPVKTVPKMTYNASSGTLSLYSLLYQTYFCCKRCLCDAVRRDDLEWKPSVWHVGPV